MTTTPPPASAPAPRQPSRTSALAVVVFLLLICSPCLGLGGSAAYLGAERDGRFARWLPLGAPPATPTGFVTADPNQVYLITVSGQWYVCVHHPAPAGGDCWQPAAEPFAVDDETDFEHSVFSGEVPPPPGEITDAVYVSIFYADAAFEARYVLLADGTVWVWEYGTGSNQSLLVLLAGPVLGLALGVVVIVVLLVTAATQRLRAPGTPAG